MPNLFSREDLEDALGKPTVSAVFDDNNSGQADLRPVESCLRYGTSMVKSFFRTINPETIFPELESDPIPDELRYAALDFGCAYVMRRRPDLVRAMGEESWTTFRDSAIEHMKRYAAAQQRLPRDVNVPSNVGATVGHGDGTSSKTTTCRRPSQWGKMGDF